MLGLLVFNIDLIDLFLECQDYNMNSYADDITPYSCTQDISSVISELRKIDQNIFDWCKNDHMKANPGNYHVTLSSNTERVILLYETSIASSLSQK